MANPNPSPENRFKPGQSGNPSGRSSKEQEAHRDAAKIAALLKLKALSCLQEKVGGSEVDSDEVLELLLSGDVLRMFKEVEDRAYGTPKQSVEASGPNGGAIAIAKVTYEVHDPADSGD